MGGGRINGGHSNTLRGTLETCFSAEILNKIRPPADGAFFPDLHVLIPTY